MQKQVYGLSIKDGAFIFLLFWHMVLCGALHSAMAVGFWLLGSCGLVNFTAPVFRVLAGTMLLVPCLSLFLNPTVSVLGGKLVVWAV